MQKKMGCACMRRDVGVFLRPLRSLSERNGGNMDLVFSRSNSDTLLPAEYYPDEMRQYWEFIYV